MIHPALFSFTNAKVVSAKGAFLFLKYAGKMKFILRGSWVYDDHKKSANTKRVEIPVMPPAQSISAAPLLVIIFHMQIWRHI